MMSITQTASVSSQQNRLYLPTARADPFVGLAYLHHQLECCVSWRATGMSLRIKRISAITTAAIAGVLLPGLAAAYVGPGAGISMLGALWGLIVGVVMALGVILFWPIRIMIRKAKAKKAGAADPAAETIAEAATADSSDNKDDNSASS
jgi:hypothetical protein